MRFLPGNAQHIGARHSQQDSFGFGDPDDENFLSHGGFLAVVCDGMGGMEHGDAASRAAVRAFLDAYRRKSLVESIPEALERSVHEANLQVVELAHSLGAADAVGTTLVAVAIANKSLYFISVGDSGLFCMSEGQLYTVNRPHVYANLLEEAVARGSISPEEALRHPERDSLTSFIGVELLEEIDRNLEPWPLEDGDTVLLASDGMFKTLDAGEIVTCLQGNPQVWPEKLVQCTLAKNLEYQDNVTVLSVTLEPEPRTIQFPPERRPTTAQLPPPPAAALPPVTYSAAPATDPVQKHSGRVAVLGLVIAGAITGGWWYAKHHKQRSEPEASPPITSPDRQVKSPPDSRPSIAPDRGAPQPVADKPGPPSKGKP